MGLRVCFEERVNILLIPRISKNEIDSLFYNDEEYAVMRYDAFLHKAGLHKEDNSDENESDVESALDSSSKDQRLVVDTSPAHLEPTTSYRDDTSHPLSPKISEKRKSGRANRLQQRLRHNKLHQQLELIESVVAERGIQNQRENRQSCSSNSLRRHRKQNVAKMLSTTTISRSRRPQRSYGFRS